jgi:hypothetical protein
MVMGLRRPLEGQQHNEVPLSHPGSMSSDLCGEITAVTTAVLALFAIVAAVVAILAFRKQSQKVNAIEQQWMDRSSLPRKFATIDTPRPNIAGSSLVAPSACISARTVK